MQAGLRARFQKEAEGNSVILIAGNRTSIASRKGAFIKEYVTGAATRAVDRC